MHIRFLLACACLFALAACSPSPEANPAANQPVQASAANRIVAGAGERHEAAIDALFEAQTRPGNPGAAVGVYHHGQLVFAKGYGLADVEAGTPITPRTQFHVASVSKQFAAFSIALLAREGKVDLDADVRTYLPYVPDFGRKITVRHLILHTSGLRDQWSLFEIGGHDLDDRLRQAQIVNMVARQRALNFDPGTRYSYSNTGYTLLGEIVRAVSGQSLREFAGERIFRPLGMDRTFFFDDVTEIVPGRAHSYEREEEGQPLKRSLLNYDNAGATSLFTTVEDMAKWAGNFSHPKVGDVALIEQVTTNGTLDDGTPIEYGFALMRKQMGGRTVVTHSGSDAGFRSLFAYYPDDDFAVTVTANVPFDLQSKVEAIADLYLPKPEGEAEAPEPAPPAEDPDADPAPLAGLYLQPDPPAQAAMRLRAEAGKVFRLGRNDRKEYVVMRQDGSFDFGQAQGRRYRPVRDAEGRVTAIELHGQGDGDTVRYERAEPAQPDAAELAAYAGRYRSDELDITYEVKPQDGKLALSSLWTTEPIVLEPVVRDRFDSQAWWSGVVLFQRDGGRVRSLTFNGGRANGVLLQRIE